MSSGKKRSRSDAETQEERDARTADLAECPYQVVTSDPKDARSKKKRRRTEGGDESDATKQHLQTAPFKPSGKFKTCGDMDINYQVKPMKDWAAMTRYNSFVLNGIKYFTDGYIRVANDSTIERQKAIAEGRSVEPRKKSDDDWVARILEIRAQDEHHVFARVYWMYWPDELPAGTRDGNKLVQGRQPYHGARELVASNHMDIINVVSVTDKADVKQMFDNEDEEVHDALYWRQGYDVRTRELSSLQPVCKCQKPIHPDKVLVGCSAEKCRAWLHSECIIHEGLLEVYKRLGADKPHKPKEPKVEEDDEDSIDAKPNGEEGTALRTKDNVEVGNEDTPTPAPAEKNGTETPDTAVKRRGRPRKSDANGQPARATPSKTSGKPYEGLFEAALLLDVSPPMLEITDLRANVHGGEKTWQERIKCLVCGTEIS